MKYFTFYLVLFLVVGPLPVFAAQTGAEAHYKLLAEEDMETLVGGMGTGQIQINEPASGADVSGWGTVDYEITYWDIDTNETLYVALADLASSPSPSVVLENTTVTGSGTVTGSFDSADVVDIDDYPATIMFAELINTAGDLYDACDDGTKTVYSRAMIYLSGDGT